MVTWVATIRLPGGHQQQVQVRAQAQYDARRLIEMQYSQAVIISGPNVQSFSHRIDARIAKFPDGGGASVPTERQVPMSPLAHGSARHNG